MSSPFLCVFGDDCVILYNEQMMLHVMLQTFETKRGASLGCRARILTRFIYDFSFSFSYFGTCIIYMVFMDLYFEFVSAYINFKFPALLGIIKS